MRILIADDDGTSRLLLQTVAATLGHDCIVTEDGASAWDLLSVEAIDVLLSDWMMPGLDGPELCRRIRTELTTRYIYTVLITSLGQREQVLKGMTAGADDYLVKPIDPFNLRARLVAAERVTSLHHQLTELRGQLEQANLELLDHSLTDPLTGLGNRRRMETDLTQIHAESSRRGQTFSVVLLDIDHFKLYNDHYGHPAGDDALRQVADCLRNSQRASESAYRYGGEEFLLLLRNCASHEALAAATRIIRSITARAIPHDVRPTPPPILTVSAGAATWEPESNISIADIVQQADQALFQAKSTGRNQVHRAGTALNGHTSKPVAIH